MTITLQTITGLSRYAEGFIDFVENLVGDNDSISLNGVEFYFRPTLNEESGVTDVLVGDTLAETIINLKAKLALAKLNQYTAPDLSHAEYTWSGNRLTVTAIAPGNDGLDVSFGVNSYSAAPQARFYKGLPNVAPGDTFTLNGVTFTFIATDEGEQQALTDVTYNSESTYGSFISLANRMNNYKYNGGQGNPLVGSDYSSSDEYFDIIYYGSDEEPNFGGGIPFSWDLTSATLNGTTSGSGELSQYRPGNTRITRSGEDLVLADFVYPNVPTIYTDTDFEAAVATLMLITGSILEQTDDPTDDVTTTRRQRALLKRVLKWLSQEITTSASSSLDDREILANRLIAKMGSRFVALNKASALSPIEDEDDLVAPDGFSFLLDGDGNYITIGDSYVIAPTPPP